MMSLLQDQLGKERLDPEGSIITLTIERFSHLQKFPEQQLQEQEMYWTPVAQDEVPEKVFTIVKALPV